MTVSLEGQQLRVVLSEAETVKYSIDSVFFDKASANSKLALAMLLKIASEKCDYKSKSTDYIIEIYPVFSGGCEIFFIPQNKTVKPKPAVKRVIGFSFLSSEGLLSAIEVLYRDKSTRYCASSALKTGENYLLTVQNLPSKAVKMVALNFADKVLSLRELSTADKISICPKNAIAVIGSAICHENPEPLG